MTTPGRSPKLLSVVFWVVLGVVVAGAAGVMLVTTLVGNQLGSDSSEPHVVGSEAPEIADRLGRLSEADRAGDDPIRSAAAVFGAGATHIRRDGGQITVIVQVISQDPEHVCYAFTLQATGVSDSIPYNHLPSCPSA